MSWRSAQSRLKGGRTSHKHARHVLVTTGHGDHTVQPMTTSGRLDLIRDEVARLEGIRHSASTHADTVADADSAKLVAYDASILKRLFDTLAKTKEMPVTAVRHKHTGR